jgi:hypothetical protein
MNLKLIIFSPDGKLIERLRAQGERLPFVSFAVGDGPTVAKTRRLDALKISQMDAVERYGFNPPHPLLEAQVLKAPSALLQRGLPRYAVSGVALPDDYQRNISSEMELVISATLKAIAKFNATSQDQILRIGMLPESLSLDKLPAAEVFGALERIYGELVLNGDSLINDR